MMCQRCEENDFVARVRSYEGERLVMDILVCAKCARSAIELGLDVTYEEKFLWQPNNHQ